MKKLVLTVIAGSVCALFGSAYADSSNPLRLAQAPGSTSAGAPPSEKGSATPRQPPDSRMDAAPGPKGATKAAPPAASTPAPAASAPAPAMETEKAPRRAARREKG